MESRPSAAHRKPAAELTSTYLTPHRQKHAAVEAVSPRDVRLCLHATSAVPGGGVCVWRIFNIRYRDICVLVCRGLLRDGSHLLDVVLQRNACVLLVSSPRDQSPCVSVMLRD